MTDNDKDMQFVEDYIINLKWSDETPDILKTLVAGNIRAFHSWYVKTLQSAKFCEQHSIAFSGESCPMCSIRYDYFDKWFSGLQKETLDKRNLRANMFHAWSESRLHMQAAQQSVQPTLLTVRQKSVTCPQCGCVHGVDLPASQSR